MQHPPIIELGTWIEAACESLPGICNGSLGCAAEVDAQERDVVQLCGSLIAVVSPSNAAYIGLSATRDGCRQLAAAMLGMDPADAGDLSDEDVRDSVGELVNLLVGAIKTRLCPKDDSLNLGLPLFFDGSFMPDSHGKVQKIAYVVGQTRCVLTVLSPTAEIHRAA